MRAALLAALLLLAGCSSASEHALLERTDPLEQTEANNDLLSLESELMLNLWLHLKREETRLQEKLNGRHLTTLEQEAVETVIKLVKTQSQETWSLLISNGNK
jgi:hypothetical protein